MRETLLSLSLLVLFSGCQGDSSPPAAPLSTVAWAEKTCHARYEKADPFRGDGVAALKSACRDGVAQVAVQLKKTQGSVNEYSKALQGCEQECSDVYIDHSVLGVDAQDDAKKKIDQQEIESHTVALPEIDGETIEQIDAPTAQERAANPQAQSIGVVLDVGDITQACAEACADEWVRISR